jgi:transposase
LDASTWSTWSTWSIGAMVIDVFGLDVTRCHWDMTSISVYGAYQETDDGFPVPALGHPKDQRTELKQIQAGLVVLAGTCALRRTTRSR